MIACAGSPKPVSSLTGVTPFRWRLGAAEDLGRSLLERLAQIAFGARKLPEFGPRNAAADGQDQQLAICGTRQLDSGIDRAISAR